MERVVFYARVSTEEEKQQNALKNQVYELEKFILSNQSWVIVDKYIDEGKSATTVEKRYEYLRLLEDMKTNKFDIVVIKDLSRLNRKELDWFTFNEMLYVYDVRLYLYTSRKFYIEEDDDVLAGVTAIMNAKRSRDLSKKMRDANKTRCELGNNVITNGTMWGYIQEQAKLVIRDDEAEIIKQIFCKYTEKGHGIRKILQELEIPKHIAERRRLRNGKISKTTLERIIKNTAYIGKMPQNKIAKDFRTKKYTVKDKSEWVYIDCPAIISVEVFQKAQEIRASRITENFFKNKGKFSGRYPLSSKISCAICNSSYTHVAYPQPSRIGKWVCTNYKERGRQGCTNISLRDDDIDNIVRDIIAQANIKKDVAIESIIKSLKKSLSDIELSRNMQMVEDRILRLTKLSDGNKDKWNAGEKTTEEFRYDEKRYNDELAELLQHRNNHTKNQNQIEQKITRLSHMKPLKYAKIEEIAGDIIRNSVEKIIVYPGSELHIYIRANFIDSEDLGADEFLELGLLSVPNFRSNRHVHRGAVAGI